MRDDAESMMYPLIEQIDIDKFLFVIWQKYVADSEIEKEIEGKTLEGKRLLQLANELKVPPKKGK